jgi:hypothetical protein
MLKKNGCPELLHEKNHRLIQQSSFLPFLLMAALEIMSIFH